jgi:hypothetical protein
MAGVRLQPRPTPRTTRIAQLTAYGVWAPSHVRATIAAVSTIRPNSTTRSPPMPSVSRPLIGIVSAAPIPWGARPAQVLEDEPSEHGAEDRPQQHRAPTTLMTRPIRCGPAGWARIVIPAGMIIPPPIPWRKRNTISEFADQASPDRTEPATNRVTTIIHSWRAPIAPLPNRSSGSPSPARPGAGRDPLNRRQRAVEIVSQRRQGNVDDRGVENRHDRPDHDHGGHCDDRAVELVRAAGLCHVRVTVPRPPSRRLTSCR